MTFGEFQEYVTERIRDYLPEEYANAEISVNETQKINQSYTALIVKKPDSIVAPSIDLYVFYEMSQQGIFADRIMPDIAQAVQTDPGNIDFEQFMDYDMVKQDLMIRVCDAETNKGLAITAHILITVQGDTMGSTLVNNGLLEQFGITEEQLFADAFANSKEILPPQIMPMPDMMEMLAGYPSKGVPQSFEAQLDNVDFTGEPMVVLTNEQKLNGASVIFYPEVLQTIGEKLNTNFYVLPSSVHEVILVGEGAGMKGKELSALVKQINSAEVSAKDRLSDNAFHYDRDAKLFENASAIKTEIPQIKQLLSTSTVRNATGKDKTKTDMAAGTYAAARVFIKQTIERTKNIMYTSETLCRNCEEYDCPVNRRIRDEEMAKRLNGMKAAFMKAMQAKAASDEPEQEPEGTPAEEKKPKGYKNPPILETYKKIVGRYLKEFHKGEENAIFSKDLEAIYDMSGRDIRRIISALRKDGVPICSDYHKGYYYAEKPSEVTGTLKGLEEHIAGMTDTIARLQMAKQAVPPKICSIRIIITPDEGPDEELMVMVQ